MGGSALWDPESMDTLVFNAFIGAACIFEYYKGKIEIVRANDKYAKVIGGEECTTEYVLNMVWEEHVDEQSLSIIQGAIERAIETNEDVVCEYACTCPPDTGKKRFLRTNLRLIAAASDRWLFFCSDEDVTVQHESEENEHRAAEQLRTLMNDTPGGFCRMRFTQEGYAQLVYANDGFRKLLGFAAGDVSGFIGRDILSLVRPDEAEEVRSTRGSILDGGELNLSFHIKNAKDE